MNKKLKKRSGKLILSMTTIRNLGTAELTKIVGASPVPETEAGGANPCRPL